MTTLERWWAADAQVPLSSLLASGGDGKKDLAQGLFALHRAGAEACELVAKTAVADEAVLIAALAENRLLVVPEALGVISKGVSTPQYAGLLVRDLLDDAESAALALYRTCLAKSVSPPVAAQRVGLVYGVPGRELGKYAGLAADPGAKEVAVRDAADRALFTYVSKVVESEYDEAKVEFSKAPGTAVLEREQTRQSEYLDEHNVENGPDGKFVAEGTGSSRLARMARLKRVQRVQRAQQAQQAAEPSPDKTKAKVKVKVSARSAPVKARTAVSQEKARVQLSVAAKAMQELAISEAAAAGSTAVAETVAPASKPAPTPIGPMPDMLSERDDPNAGLHDYLDQSLGFVVTTGQWNRMVRGMGEGPEVGARTMVAGALEEYVGAPEKFHAEADEDGNVVVHQDHQQQAAHTALVAEGEPEQMGRPEVWVTRLASGLTKGMTPEATKAMLAEEARDLLFEYSEHTGSPVSRGERGFVTFTPAYDDPEAWVVIYSPKAEGDSEFSQRPVASITEIVIPEHVARGIDQGNGRHTDFTLEKEQGLQISERATFFDTDLGVFRNRVTLESASASVISADRDKRERRWSGGKADTAVLERQSEYLDLHNIENDPTTGRFVAEGSPGSARQARLKRVGRVKRVRRAQSAAPAEAAPAASPVTASVALTASATRMRVRQQARTEARLAVKLRAELGDPAEEASDALPLLRLDPRARYTVVSADRMGMMAADDSFASPEMAQTPWPLSWRNAVGLGKATSAEDAVVDLRTGQLPDDLLGVQRRELGSSRPVGDPVVVKSKKDLDRLVGLVHDEMDNSEGQTVLTAHAYQAGGDVVVQLTSHYRPAPPVYLVRRDTRSDLDVQLEPEGAFRLLDSGQIGAWLAETYEGAKRDGGTTRFLHNPLVVTYRLSDID